jgi:uncharacterized protein with HEPN domain
MSERKLSSLIKDMITCINHIQHYCAGLSFDAFSADYMRVEACLYNIQILGEVVSKLPEDLRRSAPQIPWVLIKGMRNRLIHEYFGTDLQLVLNVISVELPSLRSELERIYLLLISQNR